MTTTRAAGYAAREAGAELAATRSFADHHPYAPRDIDLPGDLEGGLD